MPPASSPSTLLLEECYTAADARFVDLLRGLHEPKPLAALTNRWLADPRPWAREQMLRYLAEPFDQPGHAVVVKRLFKAAESRADDELLGACMVAFDCLVRRVRRKSGRWDRASRQMVYGEELFTPRNQFRPPLNYRNPRTGKRENTEQPVRPSDRLFHYRTRYYLQRRAWRYFRLMAWQKPERYVPAIADALERYCDSDFQKGENYLDSWSFMHACFGTHPAVEFTSTRAGFREGTGLADLSPAPAFPALWQTPAGLRAAVSLAGNAGARAVRTWAVKLIALPAMAAAGPLDYPDLRRLLFSGDPDVQTAAIALLERTPDLSRWTVSQWLDLLEAPGPSVIDSVCLLLEQHVHPDRLDAARCLALACARPVAVARIGFGFLQARTLSPDEIRTLLPRAAAARCAAVAPDLTAWCLEKIAALPDEYDREPLTGFFDSLSAETRIAAWDWLTVHQGNPAWQDAALWSRLAETPFDDLRLRLVDELARRAALPGTTPGDLAPVWTSVLLGVHRGGRQKPKATAQIAAAIRRDPARAAGLLPVLTVAARSVRGPEQRAGLAAVASLMDDEALAAAVRQHLPEVQWG